MNLIIEINFNLTQSIKKYKIIPDTGMHAYGQKQKLKITEFNGILIDFD